VVLKSAEHGLRAQRRCGQCLRQTARHRGGRPRKNRSRAVTRSAPDLGDLGVTKSESSRWQALARLPDSVFEEYLDGARRNRLVPTVNGALDCLKLLGTGEAHDVA
jgi:hypothetical protein